MAPTDSTPSAGSSGSFELLYSLNAYDKIPVHEYKSTKTGLTVVIAEVDGPVVHGYFCLVTEAFDDDGLPHTLEHLIFLGSEDYPFKGVLDLLANRCLASGTNAWTDIDHTCYTMETAGSEGFLTLMPIFLDHILYPVLSDEGFITEVHHITGTGEDAGVVYCEMQGRENSAESRLHLTMARQIYPGKCGYSSETGGIMKNLRESCNNTKVRNYHKEFYRPENLKIIITGHVDHKEVFRALEKLENKIVSKGSRSEFVRPWQSPVPPLEASNDLEIKYPSDEEKNGLFSVAWRGPPVVDQYMLNAATVLMKYLTVFSVSPLQKEFVEIPDPYCSKVAHNLCENSESCLYFLFQNVPTEKLPLVLPKLTEVLKKIVDNQDIDMERMKNIIIRHKLESLSNMETNPHHVVAFMIIGHMLYGNTKEDLEQRINPLVDLDKMLEETKDFWLKILREYFVENKMIAIRGMPSIEEQQQMAAEEKARIEAQISTLGEQGLKQKEESLEGALEFNERPPPDSMLTSVPIPSINSITFHDIVRYTTKSDDKSHIDLSATPVFTYFDHIKTNFVYMFALLNTADVPLDLRPYLPLLFESLFESPLLRDGKIIPHEEVVTELNNDTISSSSSLGLGGGSASSFKCGSYGHTANISIQVEASKYAKGVSWIRELLFETVFTAERLKIIATKMINYASQAKRSGRNVVAYVMKGLCYVQNSNQIGNGILKQHSFLTSLVEKLDSDKSREVLEKIESVRAIITQPANIVLYCAANLDVLKNAGEVVNDILPKRLRQNVNPQSLIVTPDHKLLQMKRENPNSSCIIGMGCLESSFFYQCTNSINSYKDPDLPALLLYMQYLIQAEGPMWKQVRGKGLAYGYTISLKANEGLLYLVFSRATNVVGAYKEALAIVRTQLDNKEWDNTLIESAKSSLIFELIDEEKTIGDAVSLSLNSYFQGVDYKFNRSLLSLVNAVTIEDLNRVGDKYVAPLFQPDKVKTAIVCDPSKADEIKTGFEKLNHKLTVYPSLEESFLKSL